MKPHTASRTRDFAGGTGGKTTNPESMRVAARLVQGANRELVGSKQGGTLSSAIQPAPPSPPLFALAQPLAHHFGILRTFAKLSAMASLLEPTPHAT